MITRRDVTRHIWGDPEAGNVADWIYASTDRVHTIVFGVGPQGRFTHSDSFRTIFGADEVFVVLQGRMVIANPETAEVHLIETGEAVCVRARHVASRVRPRTRGAPRDRVLRATAGDRHVGSVRPAPSRTSITARYEDDAVIGHWPGATRSRTTLHPIRRDDQSYRLSGDALIGVLASTDQLTVATLSLSPGASLGPAASRWRRGRLRHLPA